MSNLDSSKKSLIHIAHVHRTLHFYLNISIMTSVNLTLAFSISVSYILAKTTLLIMLNDGHLAHYLFLLKVRIVGANLDSSSVITLLSRIICLRFIDGIIQKIKLLTSCRINLVEKNSNTVFN